jgi:hypothetical protein
MHYLDLTSYRRQGRKTEGVSILLFDHIEECCSEVNSLDNGPHKAIPIAEMESEGVNGSLISKLLEL